jgi:hypothetical protein
MSLRGGNSTRAFQLIVGQQVTQAGNDKEQLVPLLEKIEESRDKNHKKLSLTVDIARRRT